jgi:peroxiredoxin Q/BCP
MYKLLIITTLLVIGLVLIQCKSKPNKSLRIGDKVPRIILLDQDGREIDLSHFIGKQTMVIYFYPKDDTPGCTKEACKFRDEFEVFSDLNTKVIGISSDDVTSHKSFAQKYNLPFTLLSDTDKKARRLFGVPAFGGGLIPGRVTYIVDKKGIIRYIFNNMKQAEMHIDKSLEILKNLEK